LTGATTTLGGSTTGFVTTGWVVVTTGDFIGDVGYDPCCIVVTTDDFIGVDYDTCCIIT
jgi:hypothetical protein